MEQRHISDAVIKRLPRYYRYLTDLMDEKAERISSEELSRRMSVTASQIRQDFNNFGGFGQQGYGYNVEYLRNEIAKILGLDHDHNIIIIGAGNLGKAIAGYSRYEMRGFKVKGIFDIDPAAIGTKVRDDLEVSPMDSLEEFIAANDIAIAVLTIPVSAAKEIAEELYGYGIRGFWNFAHVDLKLPADAYVENVHLSESLMTLSYRLEP